MKLMTNFKMNLILTRKTYFVDVIPTTYSIYWRIIWIKNISLKFSLSHLGTLEEQELVQVHMHI